MRNLVNILDLSTEEIDGLVRLASDIMKNPHVYAESCKGKIMGSLFFEPSTRTRLSFTSAMMSLGGQVLGFDQAASSSVSKGETVADTISAASARSAFAANCSCAEQCSHRSSYLGWLTERAPNVR